MVYWSRRHWQAIKVLASHYQVQPYYEEFPRFYGEVYDFLEVLEKRLEEILAERGEEYFYEVNSRITRAVRELTYSEIESLSYGIDYNLELRRESEIVSEENYPVLFHCLVALPKVRDEGLIKENHGMGYHIHYVLVQNKKQKRTNVVFTFDPSEAKPSNHTLYWERHGSGLNANPDQFGNRRRNAVYDTSQSFLSKIQKVEFRAPVSKANILWPR
ncbi:hypothetical protein VT25_10890 [Photobacterium leiognathi subsp. mandapamensis]|nr:hypothetical protein VT25_10890 [Photobacterium leiognathi subsp. mandapamensis]